jgi:hypothetical protein
MCKRANQASVFESLIGSQNKQLRVHVTDNCVKDVVFHELSSTTLKSAIPKTVHTLLTANHITNLFPVVVKKYE